MPDTADQTPISRRGRGFQPRAKRDQGSVAPGVGPSLQDQTEFMEDFGAGDEEPSEPERGQRRPAQDEEGSRRPPQRAFPGYGTRQEQPSRAKTPRRKEGTPAEQEPREHRRQPQPQREEVRGEEQTSPAEGEARVEARRQRRG
jgi:hypothetical protein